MKLYWPQRKVYLYGAYILFPDSLDNEDLKELKDHSGHSNLSKLTFKSELEEYLIEYEHHRLTTGTRVKPEQFSSQLGQLAIAAQRKYYEHSYNPVITLTDIWPDIKQRDPFMTCFWELVLTAHHLTGDIKIISMGHDGTYIDANEKETPLPYADIEIQPGSLLQKVVEPPKLKKAPPTRQRAWLTMPGKHVVAELANGDKYIITKQKTGLKTDLAPYSLMKFLIKNPATTVDLDYANKKLDGCENVDKLDEVVRQSGFSEELKALFFEISTSKKLKLREEVYLSKEEVTLLSK